MAYYAIPKRLGLCLDEYGFVATKDIGAFNHWLSRVTFSGVPAWSVVVDENRAITESCADLDENGQPILDEAGKPQFKYWDVPFIVLGQRLGKTL